MKWFTKRPSQAEDAEAAESEAGSQAEVRTADSEVTSAETSGSAAMPARDPDALPSEMRPSNVVDGVPPDTDTHSPGAADLCSGLEELRRQLAVLATGQTALHELFDARLRSDEVQAKALQHLHDQLQQYKARFLRQEMLPLLKDVIYCYDFAAGASDGLSNAEADPDFARKSLAHMKQMLLDVLFKYDVEPYRVEDGQFDRKRQQCVHTVPTTNEADDKKIAAAGVIGFQTAEQLLRKEQVTVYKYTPPGP